MGEGMCVKVCVCRCVGAVCTVRIDREERREDGRRRE